MSIKTTATTEVTLDSTALVVSPSREVIADSGSHDVCSTPLQEVVAVRKEYSIVGDRFYAGFSDDVAPTWLTDLVDNLVLNSVTNGLTNYDLLVQDVRSAIDSIDVAKNTYVEQINFSEDVKGIIGTRLQTLNATYDGKFATIVNLDLVAASTTEALALSITDLRAQFTEDINSRITIVNSAFASGDQANADSITALTTVFADQSTELTGIAEAVSGLQTYVGLDFSSSNPNGLGMLSRVELLEKQSDGVVEFLSNTYDVMLGIEDPNTDTSNDELVVDALPYVQWTNLAGTGIPTAGTRVYTDYSQETPVTSQVPILDSTLYVRSDFTDVNVDKYYKLLSGTWTAVTEADYLSSKEHIRKAHIGDVYIQYSSVAGTRNYLRSYKFIKTIADTTPPFSNDSDGYGWSLVTDTDSQAIYVKALQAFDMADGKISNFYAWSDGDGGIEPTTYDVVVKEAEYLIDSDGNYLDSIGNITTVPAEYVELIPEEVETVSAANVILWFTAGVLYRKGTSWTDKTPVPTDSGNGSFIAEGDLLTVFDPIEGDITTYWYNSGVWVTNGPAGIISKSKFFVDLDNAVTSPHGQVAKSISTLKVTSEAYANSAALGVESKFAYDSTIILGGKLYSAGFGLDALGTVPIGTDGVTGQPVFDSTFRINAERFILTSPTYPGVEATLNITGTGLLLSLDQTEATRNEPKGDHVQNQPYLKGDIVLSLGSSYIANINVPSGVVITNTTYWTLLSEKGADGISYTGTTEYYKLTNSATAPTVASGSWITGVQTPTSTNRYLWNYNKNTKSDGSFTNSTVSLITQYVEDGAPGNGISGIVEEYQLGTSATVAPTGTWSSTFSGAGAVSESVPYMWNRTTVSYTLSADVVIITLIAAKGDTGAQSTTPGPSGPRGSAVLIYTGDLGAITPAQATANCPAYWDASATAAYASEIAGDTLLVTNTNIASGWTHIYEYTGSVWTASNTFIVNGNQVVTGTLNANAIISNTTMRSPRIEFVGSTHMRISSATGFGSSNQFIEWFGVNQLTGSNVNYAALTEANAITYLKSNGDAYFGGTLSAGLLRNAAQATTKINYVNGTEIVRIGPFSTNGNNKTVVVSFSLSAVSQSAGTCPVSMQQPSVTWSLQKNVSGTWSTINTGTFTGSTDCTQEPSEFIIQEDCSGSSTYVDTAAGAGDVMYRVISNSYSRYHNDSFVTHQTLSVISTE
tara:strand:+ start:4418 stop:8032 length:3615 start_codon:yes stop_codon:yes gene_type:complete